MSQENLSNSAGPSCLKRSFGMREAVTITAGSVIGVGLFTTGSNVVGNLGIEVISVSYTHLVPFVLVGVNVESRRALFNDERRKLGRFHN